MKTKKFIFGAVLMVLACMVFVVGVFAAANATVNINGIVNFEAIGNVKATIKMEHNAENAISVEKNDVAVGTNGVLTIAGTEQSVTGEFFAGDSNNQINITASEGNMDTVSYSYVLTITNNYLSTDVADKKDLEITFTPPSTTGDNAGDDISVYYQSNYDWTTVETTKKQLVLAPGATVEIIVTFTTPAVVSNTADISSLLYLRGIQDATSQNEVAVWGGNVANAFAGGTGTSADPYQISTGAQLAYLAKLTNSGETTSGQYYKLTNDVILNDAQIIDANGDLIEGNYTQWTPIGNNTNKFQGTFDGNGYKISGMYINSSEYQYAGLFGYNNDGTIQNFGVVNSAIIRNGSGGVFFFGGVCGYNDTGMILNCYNTGEISISALFSNIGGVCGFNNTGMITNCYNTGNLLAGGKNSFLGGVCGYNDTGMITNCYNTGSLSGSTITNLYVGGVCGANNKTAATLTNCYNTGEIQGSASGADIGGVCGSLGQGTITTNCYWLYDTVAGLGMETGYVNHGGTATNCSSKTLSELQTASFYTTESNWNEEHLWDFENTWRWDNDLKRPVLKVFDK